MKKKLLASLMALCMVLSLLPATAFAWDFGEPLMPVPTLPAEPEEKSEPEISDMMPETDAPVVEAPEAAEPETAEDAEAAEEPAEEPEVETGVVEVPVAPVEDVYEDYDDDSTPAETPAEDDDIVIVPLPKKEEAVAEEEAEDGAEAEETEPAEEEVIDDPYAFETMSAVSTGRLVGHDDCQESGHGANEANCKTDVQPSNDKYYVENNGEKNFTNIKDDEDNPARYTDITLTAEGVEVHDNIEGTPGRWVGLEFLNDECKSGTVTYKYAKGDEPSSFNGSSYNGNHTGVQEGGFALYMKTDDWADGQVVWLEITWTKDGGGTVTEYYKVTVYKTVHDDSNSSTEGTTQTPVEDEVYEEDNSSNTPANSGAPTAGGTVTEAQTSGDTTTVEVAATTKTEGTTANAEVSESSMESAVDSALAAAAQSGTKPEVKIDLKTSSKADSLNVTLPASSLKTLAAAEGSTLAVNSTVASVTLDHTALSALAGKATGSSVTLSVAPVAAASLNDAQKEAVGSAAVVDLSLVSGSTVIQDFNNGSITVSLAYTLAAGQSADSITVYYLAEDGTLTPITATYVNGQLIFSATRLGQIVIK